MHRAGRRPGDLPRVDFFGDSVSWTLGTYLPEHPEMEVQVPAIQGCGITLQSGYGFAFASGVPFLPRPL